MYFIQKEPLQSLFLWNLWLLHQGCFCCFGFAFCCWWNFFQDPHVISILLAHTLLSIFMYSFVQETDRQQVPLTPLFPSPCVFYDLNRSLAHRSKFQFSHFSSPYPSLPIIVLQVKEAVYWWSLNRMVRSCSICLIYIVSLNPQNKSMRCKPHYTDGKLREAWKLESQLEMIELKFKSMSIWLQRPWSLYHSTFLLFSFLSFLFIKL